MLYVFNSGFRDNYIVNVLNTLCLPRGATNVYSYGVISPDSPGAGNISLEEASRVTALPINEPTTIIFIDRLRDGQPYLYHPLRRGTLVSAKVTDGRLYVRVKLLEMCVATDAIAYSAALTSALVPLGAPKLTGSPENAQDGQYALIGDQVVADTLLANESADDWRTLVGRLSATTALRSSADQPVVFARAALYEDANRNTPIVPEFLTVDQDRFRIVRGRKHTLVVSYVSPVQTIDKSITAEMSVTLGDDLRATSDTKAALNAAARQIEVSFATKRFVEDSKTRLTLAFTAPVGVKKFFAPKIDVPLEIVETSRTWGVLVMLVLLYCIGTVVLGLDYSKSVTAGVVVAKTVASVVQIIAIIGMFRVFGKKYA